MQESLGATTDIIGRGIVHCASVFAEHMESLAKRFNPVSLDDVSSFFYEGKDLPRRAVAITFDDGFRDNYDVAAPILERLGLQATFYIAVGCVEEDKLPWFCRLRRAFLTTQVPNWTDPIDGRPWKISDLTSRIEARQNVMRACARRSGDSLEELLRTIERGLDLPKLEPNDRLMMNWDEIRSLRRRGHIIGSHTMSHPNVAHIGPDDVLRELQESKRLLEQRLGETIVHFSYPVPTLQPHWTEDTVLATAQVGYRTAVTCASGSAGRGNRALSLPRVVAAMNKTDFVWNIELALMGGSPQSSEL
ncbi:MAG: polysaccharide deacetylase family protein [Planctomycetia bacterium]|nr:polysaccharide deacetylase family protein [Planctomycetia bacterium]